MEEKKKIPAGSLLGLMTKLPKLIKVLKVAKLAKYSKYLVTIITMFLSAMVYGAQLGWGFGVGFVLLIFIHEMGHVWALQKKGLPASAPVFIPMLGAVIFAPKMGSRTDESYMGFGGPFMGTMACIVPFLLYFLIPAHGDLFILLTFVGLWINAFNMLPIRPLDGGRILQVVGPWYKWIGIVLLLALIVVLKSAPLVLILLISIDDFIRPGKPRLYAKLGIAAVMFTMYAAGLGSALEFWIDLILFILLIGFEFKMAFDKEFVESQTETDSDALRPYPEHEMRWRWAINYVVLLIVQIVCMIGVAQLMPEVPK